MSRIPFCKKTLSTLTILRVPKHPKELLDREIQEAGYMIAHMPVYGTTDAGRNLCIRVKERVAENLDCEHPRFCLHFLSLRLSQEHFVQPCALMLTTSSGQLTAKENTLYSVCCIASKNVALNRINSGFVTVCIYNVRMAL